ncbi:hypothetical protein [Jiella pacifica]|uniref:Uncharacterized protein n=1 Tax=Jiella pacifica TaxID=2696469 RepID=A0A6N9T2Z7_9HYPH|nr:hypothetical protein [Jiella pacifica]NDW04416.1 hypothetical protein [Jiella pacifica]
MQETGGQGDGHEQETGDGDGLDGFGVEQAAEHGGEPFVMALRSAPHVVFSIAPRHSDCDIA